MAKGQKKQKQTPEALADLKKAWSIGASNIEACIHSGISETTLYRWFDDDPELRETAKQLQHKPILLAKQTVVESLTDVQNAKWYLERKCNTEFSLRTETSIEGSVPVTEIEVEEA